MLVSGHLVGDSELGHLDLEGGVYGPGSAGSVDDTCQTGESGGVSTYPILNVIGEESCNAVDVVAPYSTFLLWWCH